MKPPHRPTRWSHMLSERNTASLLLPVLSLDTRSFSSLISSLELFKVELSPFLLDSHSSIYMKAVNAQMAIE